MSSTTASLPPGDQPLVRIRDLVKVYDQTTAVRGINLEIDGGEVFGLLGPNGAGKSTTLMVLAGLLQPTRGRVEVAGYDVQRCPVEAKQRLGYVPDRPYLYPKLTAVEVLELFGDLYGMSRHDVLEQGARWLETFDLVARRHDLVDSYSHGMRQRLVLAATLLHDPDVLVLDEPTVGLDPRGACTLKQLMRERCERGKAVLMSTHTLQVAEETCDRVCILHRGRVIATGTVEQLRQQLARDGASLEEIFLAMTEGEPDVGHAHQRDRL